MNASSSKAFPSLTIAVFSSISILLGLVHENQTRVVSKFGLRVHFLADFAALASL
ncbi:hypothetical protein ACS0TY_001702 [Phlomoides rotata]